jgi:hypothetical protein
MCILYRAREVGKTGGKPKFLLSWVPYRKTRQGIPAGIFPSKYSLPECDDGLSILLWMIHSFCEESKETILSESLFYSTDKTHAYVNYYIFGFFN